MFYDQIIVDVFKECGYLSYHDFEFDMENKHYNLLCNR